MERERLTCEISSIVPLRNLLSNTHQRIAVNEQIESLEKDMDTDLLSENSIPAFQKSGFHNLSPYSESSLPFVPSSDSKSKSMPSLVFESWEYPNLVTKRKNFTAKPLKSKRVPRSTAQSEPWNTLYTIGRLYFPFSRDIGKLTLRVWKAGKTASKAALQFRERYIGHTF
jgi:hypothetical protein